MVHHAHKTCTDWSSTRLYDPYPTLALKSYPTLSTTSPSISVCSSAASSTTLTPTPSTTPPQPKSFLTDDIGGSGILSASPPSLLSSTSSSPSSEPHAPQPPSSGVGASSICTLTDLETLHAGHAFTHLPCPHERCPDPACAAPALHTDAILVSVHGSYFRSAKTGAPMAAAAVWFAEGSPLNKVVRLDEEYPGGDLGGGGGEGGGMGDGGDGGNGKGGGHVNGGSSFGEVTRQRVELLAGIRALERVADVVRALEEEARRRRRQQRKRGGNGGGGAAMGMPGTRDWYVAGVEKKKQQKHGNGMGGLRYGEDEEDRDEEEEREMEDDEDGALSQLVLKTHSKYLVRAAVEGLAKWKANGWMNSRGKVVANVDLLWYLDRRITWLEWVGVEVMFLLVGKEDNEGAIKLIGKGLD